MITSVLRDDILWISFSDPKSRNAFSITAARELRALLTSHIKVPTVESVTHATPATEYAFHALVFSAKGRVFCSGGQLDDYASMTTSDEGRRVNDEIRDVLALLSSLPVPTIACASGDAFGGGVELLSCFDYVLSVPYAMFGLWQRKIGLTFGWGGGARLEKRLGASALKRLTLSTAAISAREAHTLGLVDQVVSESALEQTAEELAKRLITLPPEPVTILKSFDAAKEAADFNSLWWNKSHRRVLDSRKR